MKKPCSRCRRALVPHPGPSRCPPCERQHQRDDVAYRGTAAQRGYDGDWTALRRRYAAQHPVCESCLERPTAIVDHRTPHRGNEALRMSWNNLCALCRPCHQRKTATEGPGYRAPTRD